jgi:nitroreductase/dihydropteridine reductase
MSLIEKLNWRYATKAMNGTKVEQVKVEAIVEAARLAPTSSGLQPFEIYVITNEKVKNDIRAIGWNQSVITDCSHLLVFAAWENYTPDRIHQMFDFTNEVRGFKNEGWENYRQQLLKAYLPSRLISAWGWHCVKQLFRQLIAHPWKALMQTPWIRSWILDKKDYAVR